MLQAWPLSIYYPLKHSDLFRNAHTTQAKPLRLISRTFVGAKEKKNLFSCWTWSRKKEILELPRCEDYMS